MESAARCLAEAAASTCFETLPQPVRSAYRDYVLDTISVMAAGAAHPSLRAMRTAFAESSGTGRCSIVGHSAAVPASVAGLLNGSAMTVLQLQDGHRRARGHPMSHVLPAALAIAEEVNASGQQLASAIVAGYEASARVGASLGGMQPLLHDTGTFGCIGAAVAAAFLLTHEQEKASRINIIESAIGNSAAVALFPFRDTCMEGATGHHLFVGLGVQNGIVAARSSAAGLQPSERTLERFFGPRAGEAFNVSQLTAGISAEQEWSHYEIEQAYLKWHPVCAHLGPMLDCIEALRERIGDLKANDLSQVSVQVYSTALQYDSPHPKNDLAARFSFRHAAALALVFGPVRHDSFNEESLQHPNVESLISKIKLMADTSLDELYPENRPARVTLRFIDGGEETAEVLVPKGDGARRLTRQDVDAKSRRLADAAWGEGVFSELRQVIDLMEGDLPDDFAAKLGSLLRRPFAG